MRLNNALIVFSFVGLLVSFWNRNDLPSKIEFVAEIESEPMQTPTRKASFGATVNGVDYTIEPEYAYDITGMVVSYRHHGEDNSRMHRLAEDHLNMLDVCVVWGDNTRARLQEIEFWNGIFTCNVNTRSQTAWESFDMNQLSNNHLLSDDPDVRRAVKELRIGDQIRVRGYLVSYTSPTGTRGTSTTRTDTGDGACETIFIEDFEIVAAAFSPWRTAMYVSLALLLFGLVVHFRRPYRPY